MKVAYPTLIEQDEDMFLAYVPDLEAYTQGESLEDAIYMARDIISMKCITLEDNGIPLPKASTYDAAIARAKEKNFDEDFDFTGGICTMVDADLTAYRKKVDHKMVRRNVTLPSWMNEEAERLKLNVSRILQEALKEKIESMA
jgi:Uncharacterised protein family (UPF0150).